MIIDRTDLIKIVLTICLEGLTDVETFKEILKLAKLPSELIGEKNIYDIEGEIFEMLVQLNEAINE